MNSIYAAVDVETTGLKQGPDKLLEIAVYPVGSAMLNVMDKDGYHAIVKYDRRVAGRMRAAADPYVKQMHDKTGLWGKLSGGGAKPLEQIDAELVHYLKRFVPEPGEMPVMGNSVRLDMNFIDTFLPNTASHLSYHMRDVSTVAGLAADWFALPRFEKKMAHTAKGDILECIEELKHYRNQIFYPGIFQPGRGGKITPVSETDNV
jgi:oligoribonuclease